MNTEIDHTQIDAYLGLDLSANGEIVGRLLQNIPADEEVNRIDLSDHVGVVPANLTPGMVDWYQNYVAGPRGQALDAVAAILGVNDETKGSRGVFVEQEVSQQEDLRIQNKRNYKERHREQHSSEYKQYEEAEKDYRRAEDDYNELRSRLGREAKLTPKWYPVALLVIGIAEFLINFESFSSIKVFTPAIATGVTIIVALALAVSSHLHGTVIRQLESRFGAYRKDGDRRSSLWMINIGFLLLFFVLALVWYARDSLFADQILENSVIGGDAPSAWFMIGGSMLGNMIVWLLGVAIAFFTHDEDHKYPDALMQKNKSKKKYYTLRENVESELERHFKQIDASCDLEIEQANTKHKQMLSKSDQIFATGISVFTNIKKQDDQVIAALRNYKSALLKEVRGRNMEFRLHPKLEGDAFKVLDAGQYAALKIDIKYCGSKKL